MYDSIYAVVQVLHYLTKETSGNIFFFHIIHFTSIDKFFKPVNKT